ncbi:MAG: ATP-dependent RNA helicase HrpA [Burkholderiaceae bacterium]|jgi:ATP-dependent helicase HrpA|nr:ATP-dependent RNA helicase HrpA [Burkholderiaceae bacterium]
MPTHPEATARPPKKRRSGPRPATDGASRRVAEAPSPYAPEPLPPFEFPAELPVSAARDEIVAALRRSPVVIVSGETGSGKTTQLPKICALAGCGRRGRIGHTQPRRIAATSVARRIAEELGSPPGQHVGWKIRFGETLSAGAMIKLMTDGILLAETQADPLLSEYDTLIIDEAHERSLNIDFLLGYLRQLIEGPRRGDLKLVITSATIDSARFAEHFAGPDGPAPVIEVSGRLYPVEIRWRPPETDAAGPADARSRRGDDDDEDELPARIEAAIDELWREAPGDVLVFLPGEREIRDCAEHLRRAAARQAGSGSPLGRGMPEILPLFARLPAADQQRIFAPGDGRRIVLSTNVAETSLTVPGIRYVVDSGLARVKRYRYRGKVEQLQIEPVSQAAARQRAGRCGRVADGVCIRLYDQADFDARPAHTDPEILRSSLAGVILRMRSLHLSDIASFPFVDPPPRKAIADGQALLQELHAIDEAGELTAVGRQLARLPLDPRIGRMLLAGHQGGCLREVMVIAAGLSSQDPRQRPLASQQAADAAHRRFADPASDFAGWVRLWNYWQEQVQGRAARGESNRQLATRLEREFLSVRRLREWADVHGQLERTVREMQWRIGEEPASAAALHQALLTGLLGNLGTRAPDDALYMGTHQTRFAIHPGSSVRKPPRWLMAAELVDTGRLYARTVARIEPEWIERLGAHLIRRSWSDPFWSREAGEIMAYERATIYGLVLYAQRRVSFARREPALAREALIRHALVRDEWLEPAKAGHLPFLAHNRRLMAEIEKLEHRIRRPELLVDERFLFDWFDARVPVEVTTGRELEAWYRKAVRGDANLLRLDREAVLRKDAEGVDSQAFPREIRQRGASFRLDYHFDPGASDDGITMTVPLPLLNQVDAAACEWLVPGMLREKVEALLKSLPPRSRRQLVPIPAYATEFVARWSGRSADSPLVEALRLDLRAERSLQVQAADFRTESLPAHLTMRLRLVGADGRFIAESRSLAALRAEHGERAQGAFQSALADVADRLRKTASATGAPTDDAPSTDGPAGPRPTEARGQATEPAAVPASLVGDAGRRWRDWSFGELPELLEVRDPAGGATMIGFPALVDHEDEVGIEVFDDPDRAASVHREGMARLFAIALREPLRFFARNVPDFPKLSLLYSGFGDEQALRAALVRTVIDRVCLVEPLPADADGFAQRVGEARSRLALVGQELARLLMQILQEHQPLGRKLSAIGRAFPEARADIETQLGELMPPDFIVATPAAALRHFPRYLKAIDLRIEALRKDPQRDARGMSELAPLVTGYRRRRKERRGRPDARLDDFRWLLEELRVSLFAQGLRTPMPVSPKRLHKALAAID